MRLLMRASHKCIAAYYGASQQANGERVSWPLGLGHARFSLLALCGYEIPYSPSIINLQPRLRTYLTHGHSGAKRGLGQRDTYMPSLRHRPVAVVQVVAVAAHLAFSHSVRFGHNLKISHFAFDKYKMDVPNLSILSITRSTSLKPP